MAYRTPIKTPISKSLLTPCRRVGLSKPRKTPKVLNLDSPSPVLKTSTPLKATVTPKLSRSTRVVDDLTPTKKTAPSEQINIYSAKNLDTISVTPTPLNQLVLDAKSGSTPVKKQDIKSKKLFSNNAPANRNHDQITNTSGKRHTNCDNVCKVDDNNKINSGKINDRKVQRLKNSFEKNKNIDKDENESKMLDLEDSKEARSEEFIGFTNIEHTASKKLPIFHEESSSTVKNLVEAPIQLAKFTTKEWLEDDEFRDLKEKKFDCQKVFIVSEEHKIQKNCLNSSDSDGDNFKKHKIGSRIKKRPVKTLDSSSDDEMNEESQIIEKHIKIGSSGNTANQGFQDKTESDEEFSKERIKMKRKSSKRTLSNHQKKSSKKSKNGVKLKREVTVNLIKILESDVETYTGNKMNELEERQHLIDEINAMKALLKKKEEVLDSLKRAQIYMKKHDPAKMEELSNVWLNGCRKAIIELLQLLNQHGPVTMTSLLKKLQISPEILEKLSISDEESVN